MAMKISKTVADYYFQFDEEEKCLFWNTGEKAGTKLASGKTMVGLTLNLTEGTVKYYTDKLVILMNTGVYPTGRVKHLNGDNGDDTYENLEYNV